MIGQWRLILENLVGNTDLVWLWSDGEIQWSILVIGLIAICVSAAGYVLWLSANRTLAAQAPGGRTRSSLYISILSFAFALLLMGIWLPAAARNPHYGTSEHGYRLVLQAICELAAPDDVVVTIAPAAYSIAMSWQPRLCRVHHPIYGYAESSAEHPEAIMVFSQLLEQHRQLWFITAGLPPNAPSNTVERWLADYAYKATDQWYNDYRLIGYATSAALNNASKQILEVAFLQNEQEILNLSTVHAPKSVYPGQILPVELTYQLQHVPEHQLRWFVQLLGPDGIPVALLDSAPMHGYTMFLNLPIGQPLVERVGLLLPTELTPGTYRLIAGLYDPETDGAPRLTTQSGKDFVQIVDIEIVRDDAN